MIGYVADNGITNGPPCATAAETSLAGWLAVAAALAAHGVVSGSVAERSPMSHKKVTATQQVRGQCRWGTVWAM